VGRLVFVGKPSAGKGLKVIPQQFELVEGMLDDVVDTSKLALPSPERVREITKKAGVEMSISRDGNSVKTYAYDLTLEMELETKEHGILTVRDAMPKVPAGGKLRCQTPFRDSNSWAALLTLGKDGAPCVYDVGTSTTHWPAPNTMAFEEFMATVNSSISSVRSTTPSVETTKHRSEFTDIATLFSDLTLRHEDVQKMAEAEFLIPDMIVRGHVAAYVSPGNGGKTTIFIHLCEQLSAMGMKVLYINVDGSPGDLKRHYQHASKHGYQVIAPDARDGKSTQNVMEKLNLIAQSDLPCHDYVFILDTLKKFVDVIDKRQAKQLYKLMRTLTVKGATICLLGHCNKYKDEDGKAIFEGTADLRNDLDELIYLDGYKNEESGCLEVTTRPDKVRAEFKPKSFIIDLNNDRAVREPSAVIKILSKDERELLELVMAAIREGNHSQKDIVGSVKGKTPFGDKKIRDCLLRHSNGNQPEIKVENTGRGKDLHYSTPDPFEDLGPYVPDEVVL
jgi:hypothetical protein